EAIGNRARRLQVAEKAPELPFRLPEPLDPHALTAVRDRARVKFGLDGAGFVPRRQHQAAITKAERHLQSRILLGQADHHAWWLRDRHRKWCRCLVQAHFHALSQNRQVDSQEFRPDVQLDRHLAVGIEKLKEPVQGAYIYWIKDIGR